MPIDTIWLSNYAAIKRIIDIYNPLVLALQTASDEYPIAAGLLFRVPNFRIIGLLLVSLMYYHLNNACHLNIRSFDTIVEALKTNVYPLLEGKKVNF
jgi:hypothetical protein